MKTLALTLIIGVAALTSANAAATLDVYPHSVQFGDNRFAPADEQNIQRYLGTGPCRAPMASAYGTAPMAPAYGTCGACATDCCPSACCNCIPTCCPDVRGIFDGGLPRGDCSCHHITSSRCSYWAGSGGPWFCSNCQPTTCGC